MTVVAGQQLNLIDGVGRELGSVRVRELRGDVLTGTLSPGTAYGTIEPLFREWVECVNGQLFTEADRLDGVIRDLRLRLQTPDGAEYAVADFQPGDEVVTIRVGGYAERNGSTSGPAERRLSGV